MRHSAWLLAIVVAACASPTLRTGEGASMSEWRVLFDGRNLDAWRGFRREEVPRGWQIVDGELTRVGDAGDLITRARFADFELTLEWRIAEGGNSGIMYRVTEDEDATYKTGPEMQVLDDARHPDGRSPLTSAGAVYGLYPSQPGVARPAGEWNAVRIVARGDSVEHWLNGARVAAYRLGSAEWTARVTGSKFKEWAGYGRAASGHIALQDHGDRVAFRRIRIRSLP